LSEKLWGEINRMGKLKGFEKFVDHFIEKHHIYKEMYDSPNPH
jgi:hypothetical protein